MPLITPTPGPDVSKDCNRRVLYPKFPIKPLKQPKITLSPEACIYRPKSANFSHTENRSPHWRTFRIPAYSQSLATCPCNEWIVRSWTGCHPLPFRRWPGSPSVRRLKRSSVPWFFPVRWSKFVISELFVHKWWGRPPTDGDLWVTSFSSLEMEEVPVSAGLNRISHHYVSASDPAIPQPN